MDLALSSLRSLGLRLAFVRARGGAGLIDEGRMPPALAGSRSARARRMRRCGAECLAEQANRCVGQRFATAAWFAPREDLRFRGCGGSAPRNPKFRGDPRTVRVR